MRIRGFLRGSCKTYLQGPRKLHISPCERPYRIAKNRKCRCPEALWSMSALTLHLQLRGGWICSTERGRERAEGKANRDGHVGGTCSGPRPLVAGRRVISDSCLTLRCPSALWLAQMANFSRVPRILLPSARRRLCSPCPSMPDPLLHAPPRTRHGNRGGDRRGSAGS